MTEDLSGALKQALNVAALLAGRADVAEQRVAAVLALCDAPAEHHQGPMLDREAVRRAATVEPRQMKFVELNGRLCIECGQTPRFFHERDDGTVICCRHDEDHG